MFHKLMLLFYRIYYANIRNYFPFLTRFGNDSAKSNPPVEIKDGKIRVSEAECPDKTCVRTGWLSSSAMPIVCLPNHLIIEFEDENSEIDALAE